jgi:hypothetical protein
MTVNVTVLATESLVAGWVPRYPTAITSKLFHPMDYSHMCLMCEDMRMQTPFFSMGIMEVAFIFNTEA